jgi:hypothetical protein
MGKMKWLFVMLMIPTLLMATNLKDVVINEVMWMGSVANTADEWIELYNTTGSSTDLTGWTLVRNTTVFNLSGTIAAHSYFLIERAENNTDVPSDLLLSTMSLTNTGNTLKLIDASSFTVDSLSCGGGWYAGSNTPPKYSMERVDPMGNDVASNWANNDGVTRNGHDSGGNALNATPRAQNSVYNPGGGDTTPPSLLRAYAMSATRVDVLFDEPVEPTSAEDLGNYSIDPDIGLTDASQDGTNPALVHLTSGTMSVGTIYTLTVTGVADTASNYMPGDEDYSFYGNITPISMVKQDLSRGNYVPDLLGAQVTIHGIAVSSDYNFQLTNTDFNVQDATGGVDVFQYTVILGAMAGDEVIISGKVDQYRGKTEVAGPYLAMEVLSTGNTIDPLSHIYTVAYVISHGEEVEGWFGGIQHVTKVSGTWPTLGQYANIIVTDDGGLSQMILYIDSETDIDGTPEPVWPVDIAGIFAQYDATTPPDSNYELQPRGLLDFYPDGTLPVELVSFEGFAGNREAKLMWTTASETDNDHFYLLRSTDNLNFNRATNNIPATNSPTGSSYSYVDGNLVNGTTYFYKLVDVDINGNENVNGIVVNVTPTVGSSFAPDTYALNQNYPNPFNPNTTIAYDIREAGHVTLTVFDILGREVASLVNGNQTAGSYSVEFNATTLSSGIYFYQLKVNDFSALKKMVVLK